jgi:hypothetical protein
MTKTMDDTQKIEEIKRIIESKDFSNFDELLLAMVKIVDVVYPKRQKLQRND